MRAKKPKTFERRWFHATLTRDGAFATLHVRPGALRITVDPDGNQLGEKRDPTARLWAEIGDHLILFGPGDTETVGAEVARIDPAGHPIVMLMGYGAQLADDTTEVRVLAGLKARARKQRRAVA